MNLSLLSNLAALLITLAGFLLPGTTGELVLSTGLYALSGGITNWLAIHMLFEKVPGFYGSGVIPARFNEFKSAIHQMIMEQFFNPANVQQFFSQSAGGNVTNQGFTETVINKIDFNLAFEELVDVILKSSFGSMLGMLGGAKVLDSLRLPFVNRMQEFLNKVVQDEALLAELGKQTADSLLVKVEAIVNKRLEELTPQMVKEIIQLMIHKHLGWLVLWGAVLGALMGLIVELLI
jgi:uncharacterized membrane protein YheB (UPF0754 family)